MNCIFCNIIRGCVPCHRVWENHVFLAFLDNHPINPGHTLLIPKIHVDSVFDLPDGVFTDLLEAARRLERPLREAIGMRRIGIAVEGFRVPHVHVHLVPVNGPNELNPTRAKAVPDDQLADVAARIRERVVSATV